MSKILVIVESNGKVKKISEYLGSNYIVRASFGHCMDLDPKTLSIDIENNYKPYYITLEGKHKLVNELKKISDTCSEVILAADQDREGEFIAHSLSLLLELKNPKRIMFNQITKKAIDEAINNPKQINQNMVNSQQARRILDRLIGYKISPILSKFMDDSIQSAGRVQSVVLKIIKDKEDEINKSSNDLYFKTQVFLLTNTKNKIFALLENKIFKTIDDAKQYIQQINKNTIFKVINIDNKINLRKPSPPFITSTLQQEASTKLKFNIKKTMDIAQKLYEAGLITYMRTDSINLSEEIITELKDYIIKTFGLEYSNSINYKNNSNSQEAHEAIRPTNILLNELLDYKDKDGIKLYNLIWKRTVASQMSFAKIFIQTIKIESSNENSIWISKNETIEFNGFLILYNDSEDEQENNDKIEIKINDILKYNNLKVSEEYIKSPLRYNEASLIKFLEKNNIGRPSTFSSIVHKNIERKYIEIKNIDGIKKESKLLEMNKQYIIKESINEVVIGHENKKMVLTDIGLKVLIFMLEKFDSIMQIKFTAEFEEYLDKIAEGKAKWINIIDKFYKVIYNNLILLENINSDILIGNHPETNQHIFKGKGKYGPYIKFNTKFYPIENLDIITIEEAINILKYPKCLGKIEKKQILLCKGKFGLYIKYGKQNITIKNKNENEIDLNYVKSLLLEDKYAIKTFKIKDKIINIKKGQYNYYIQIVSLNNTKQNIPIPINYNIEKINIKEILEIISNK